MSDTEGWKPLMTALDYEFKDWTLCRDALTHRSFAHERPQEAPRDNERLEFLGDAVVGAVVSLMLWENYPEAPEGELTRRRSDLVCEAGLQEVAMGLGLGELLRLGRGEERSGGRDKARLLASAFEAVMGAVFVDGGEAEAVRVGRHLFGERIHQHAPGSNDYKSRFQEITQANGRGMPRYQISQIEGPDHARRYTVSVIVGSEDVAEGSGSSKSEAEQAAAREGLAQLEPPKERRDDGGEA